MTTKKDRNELLECFVRALAELTCEAVNELSLEQKQALDVALSTKAAVVQFAINMDPLTVIGFLASPTRDVDPQVLFRIETRFNGFPVPMGSGASH